MIDDVPEPLRHGPFRSATALGLGVTPAQLRGPTWRRLCRDVYAWRGLAVTDLVRLRAAGLVVPPGAVVTGRTAAWLLGCDVRLTSDEPVEVTAPPGVTMSARGGLIRPRQATLAADDVIVISGVAVSSPERTAFDLARRANLVERVVALDAMWHAGLVTPETLLAYAARRPGWRGVRQVPRVVDLADPGAESPMETRLRLLVVLRAGLPRPTTQLPVLSPSGHLLARLDMGYDERRLGLEFDGRWHAQPDVRMRDLRRSNDLVAMGWRCLVFGWEDVLRHPAITAARITEAYRRLVA